MKLGHKCIQLRLERRALRLKLSDASRARLPGSMRLDQLRAHTLQLGVAGSELRLKSTTLRTILTGRWSGNELCTKIITL